MSTFFMFGNYSAEGIREISGERTALVRNLVDKMGGKIRNIYALFGEYDLVFIVDFPTMTDAMKAAVVMGQRTGISFSTAAAMPVDEFDKIADDLATEIESARMEAGE
jgi:uncharacterized protein with GYD domain